MLRLVLANLNYSSWSMRPWLALEHAGAEYKSHDVGMKTSDGWKDKIFSFSGAGKVPILIDGSLSVHESLAICEYVAELYPEARLWPADRALRARGRAISCEMLSGFGSLRQELTSNLRARGTARSRSAQTDVEIARVQDIWRASLDSNGGPFLLGEFSIADCMYFPVAARFRTYGVELPPALQAYTERLFALPIVQKLEALAQTAPAIPEYDAYLTR